ncbi:hypothetical protein ACLOJK_015943 [Asimina triloba]
MKEERENNKPTFQKLFSSVFDERRHCHCVPIVSGRGGSKKKKASSFLKQEGTTIGGQSKYPLLVVVWVYLSSGGFFVGAVGNGFYCGLAVVPLLHKGCGDEEEMCKTPCPNRV